MKYKIKYIQPCTMIISLPIRGTYFSFLFRKSYANQNKKQKTSFLYCPVFTIHSLTFIVPRSLEIKVYRCQTIQRWFVMQIQFFLS